MPTNPAHSPHVISTSLPDLSTAFTPRDKNNEVDEASAAALETSDPPGLGTNSVRTRRSAHSSVSARSATPYQRNKRARNTTDTDLQDESLGDLSSRRKSSRRDNAPPPATASSQPQPSDLANMDLEDSEVFEPEASEKPTPLVAPFQDNGPSTSSPNNPLFAALTSGIKSLTDKPISDYHEDVFSAVPSLARSILAHFATSTSNAELVHDPASVNRMKSCLISVAEDFVRKLKLGDSLPGLSDSIHAPPSDPLNTLLEEVRELRHTQEKISHRLCNLEGSNGSKQVRFSAPPATPTSKSYARAVSGTQSQDFSPSQPSRTPVAAPSPTPSVTTLV